MTLKNLKQERVTPLLLLAMIAVTLDCIREITKKVGRGELARGEKRCLALWRSLETRIGISL